MSTGGAVMIPYRNGYFLKTYQSYTTPMKHSDLLLFKFDKKGNYIEESLRLTMNPFPNLDENITISKGGTLYYAVFGKRGVTIMRHDN